MSYDKLGQWLKADPVTGRCRILRKKRDHGPRQGRWKDCCRGKEGTRKEGTDAVRVCWLVAGTEGIPL